MTPTYNANGNLTRDETGRQFVYDAWNRLVAVKSACGNTLKSYTYDGLDRRIRETASGTTTNLYYSDGWQLLEERVGGQVKAQYVWSPVYVHALMLRDRDTNVNATLDERLYVAQDANHNVTGLFDKRFDFFDWLANKVIGTDNVLRWDSVLGNPRTGWFAQTSNFFAGMGDTVSFGGTRRLRNWLDYDDVVDHSSTAYRVGNYAGVGGTSGGCLDPGRVGVLCGRLAVDRLECRGRGERVQCTRV